MTTISVNDIITGFPNNPLTRIIGKPNYESIQKLKREVCANLASVHTHLGGGMHGHLGAAVNAAKYALYSATPYVAPGAPPLVPVFANNATAAQREQVTLLHKEA